MRITDCLLDARNSVPAGGMSIGRRVSAAGKERLWEERPAVEIDTVVIHYISAVATAPRAPFSLGNILKVFCDFVVSSHYLISRRGRVFRLVPEEKKAWHAGGSIMPAPDDRRGVNTFSIGIELAATADTGFTLSQYRSLAALCAGIEKRYGRRFAYVGHSQIAGERAAALGLRKDIKTDPGGRFDWKRFFGLLEGRRRRLRLPGR